MCTCVHHSCDLSPAPPAPLAYFFPAGVLFSTENAKGTTLNMPAMPSLKKICQTKPTSTSIKARNMPYLNIYSIERTRQPKHQVRHLNQKNTPTKTPNTKYQKIRQCEFYFSISIYAVLSWGNYCRKFTHFSAYNLKFWKLRWRTKNDKSQVWALAI